MARVLIAEDDPVLLEVMVEHLHDQGIESDTAADGAEAFSAFDPRKPAVVVTDLQMPRMDGRELLSRIKQRHPGTVVVVISAFGTIEKAVDIMKAGAFDFIPKPCSRDHFIITVKKAMAHSVLASRVQELENIVATGGRDIIYRAENMKKVVRLIDQIAPSQASVLLTGESGTGKELFARRLHRRSPRIDKPFVAVNCAAIPKELMESELFGHAKGAFTGANQARKGKFELADKGTLFLDEIGELPLDLQTKLLRALAEQVIDVIGKEHPSPVDVRVIAATNQDLGKAVTNGRFRQDLYYRLNVVQVNIPPLRERREDIMLLAEFFLRRYSQGRPLVLIDETRAALESHNWPGNVRELENICQRLALLAQDDEITPDLLPPLNEELISETLFDLSPEHLRLPPGGLKLADLEKNVIVEALKVNHFNQAKTARFLGIQRHVLLYRIQKYGIELPNR